MSFFVLFAMSLETRLNGIIFLQDLLKFTNFSRTPRFWLIASVCNLILFEFRGLFW